MTLDFDPDTLSVPTGHHIGGRFIDLPGDDIAVFRPSDHQLMGVVRDGGADAVDQAVAAAQAGLAATAWSSVAPVERARVLHAFADAVQARAEELGRIEAAGSCRLIALATPRDVVRTAGVIRYYAEYCDKLEGTITETERGALCLVRREPYGIVGAIVPWNFPLITAAWKFAPALAAGNAVVMKTSELTPHSLLLLAEIATQAGLPPGLLNVVNGIGPTTGSAIVSHPAIGKISFTGSTATGVQIMVHRRAADALLAEIEARAAARRAGPTWQQATTLAPIINEKQTARIETLLRQTLDAGATLRTGGTRIESRNAGCYFAPTILEDVTPDMAGYREEFFGPVLTVDRFDAPEEAFALAAHPSYGLAASVFTQDISLALKAADSIDAGMVWVNQHGRAPEFTFPAGGFKQSGFGKDMGRAGIEAFSRQKAVWINYTQ